MAYKKIKSYNFTEVELREIWKVEYCDSSLPVFTFDGILVKFYEDMFDHVFFESDNRKQRDKSILSLNRLEKIHWIKDTLQDASAILKQGWDRDKKIYTASRRVAFVKNNYVVVIQITKTANQARFITAYELQEDENISKIKTSPDWTRL